jgi:hypothetical protein
MEGEEMRRLTTAAAIAALGCGLGTAVPSLATASPAPTVTGTWHLHTNDCFFGVCNYTLQLKQVGTTLSGPAGSGIRGTVKGFRMSVGLTGASEDDWRCTGTLNASFTKLTGGTFVDGTGGSGTCTAYKVKV